METSSNQWTGSDVDLLLEQCNSIGASATNAFVFVEETPYADLEENPLLGASPRPLLIRPEPSIIDASLFSLSWLQSNAFGAKFVLAAHQAPEPQLETVPALLSRFQRSIQVPEQSLSVTFCPQLWRDELARPSKLNPDSIDFEKDKSDGVQTSSNAFYKIDDNVFLFAASRGFVHPLRKNASSNAEMMYLCPATLGSIVWFVANPSSDARALEGAVAAEPVTLMSVSDLSELSKPFFVLKQKPGTLVVFPSGCFYQGFCCDNADLVVSTALPPHADMFIPALNQIVEEEEQIEETSQKMKKNSDAMDVDPPQPQPQLKAEEPAGASFMDVELLMALATAADNTPSPPPGAFETSDVSDVKMMDHNATPEPQPGLGPFSLFPTIRQVLAAAGAPGVEVYQIADKMARDVRFMRILPPNFQPTLLVLLALNFLRARSHTKSINVLLGKQYVAPLKSSDLPDVPANQVKWRWVGDKIAKDRVADVLFELEAAFWFAITRGMFRVDAPKKIFQILLELGSAPKQPLDIPPYTPAQKAEFHNLEKHRFLHPQSPFEYTMTIPVCVPPIEHVVAVSHKSTCLVPDRPPSVKVTSVVADAAARLPGGVGLKADVERLLLESQYAGTELHSSLDLVRSTVTHALDRLSRLEDPPVKFCRDVKLWVYRYRQRLPGDFGDAMLDDQDAQESEALSNPDLATNSSFSEQLPEAASSRKKNAAKVEQLPVSDITPYAASVAARPDNAASPHPEGVRVRYHGPSLMTATKMPGLRTVWWSPPGTRRPVFSGLPPRRASRADFLCSPSQFDRRELIYRIIRSTKRDAQEVEAEALTLPNRGASAGSGPRRKRAAAESSSVSTAAMLSSKRSASANHQLAVAAAEAAAHQLLASDQAKPIEAEPNPPEVVVEQLRLSDKPVFLRDAPKQQVFRSFDTDPSYLPDNSIPSLDSICDLPIFSPPAFDSFVRFGDFVGDSTSLSFCLKELDQTEALVQNVIATYSHSVSSFSSQFNRTEERAMQRLAILHTQNASNTGAAASSAAEPPTDDDNQQMLVDTEKSHPDNPYSDPSLSVEERSTILRLVDLPCAVGYIHWLQDLENAVDERLWYHDWRPKPRFSQKVKNDKAPEALQLADPWRMFEARASTILPCHSVEHNRTLYTSSALLPEALLVPWKILLAWPTTPLPELARHRLPMDGRWAPFPWSTLYEAEVLYLEPPVEKEGRKKRRGLLSELSSPRSSSQHSNAAEHDGDDIFTPPGKRRAAARAAAAVRSSFDDAGEEEDFLPIQMQKPLHPKPLQAALSRRATLNSSTAALFASPSNLSLLADDVAPAKGGKKRKRDQDMPSGDSTYSPPGNLREREIQQQTKRRIFSPYAPKSDDEKRRERLFAASKARRRSVGLPGPDTSPHLCCRVVLMKARNRPWWPAALLTKEGFHHFALKTFSGGEYVWPFRPEESYPWVSEKCVNPYVSIEYLDALMAGEYLDDVIDNDPKAQEFLEQQYDAWLDALQAAKEFLLDFWELLDSNAQGEGPRFANLPRQIPGVSQLPPFAVKPEAPVPAPPVVEELPPPPPPTKTKAPKAGSTKKTATAKSKRSSAGAAKIPDETEPEPKATLQDDIAPVAAAAEVEPLDSDKMDVDTFVHSESSPEPPEVKPETVVVEASRDVEPTPNIAASVPLDPTIRGRGGRGGRGSIKGRAGARGGRGGRGARGGRGRGATEPRSGVHTDDSEEMSTHMEGDIDAPDVKQLESTPESDQPAKVKSVLDQDHQTPSIASKADLDVPKNSESMQPAPAPSADVNQPQVATNNEGKASKVLAEVRTETDSTTPEVAETEPMEVDATDGAPKSQDAASNQAEVSEIVDEPKPTSTVSTYEEKSSGLVFIPNKLPPSPEELKAITLPILAGDPTAIAETLASIPPEVLRSLPPHIQLPPPGPRKRGRPPASTYVAVAQAAALAAAAQAGVDPSTVDPASLLPRKRKAGRPRSKKLATSEAADSSDTGDISSGANEQEKQADLDEKSATESHPEPHPAPSMEEAKPASQNATPSITESHEISAGPTKTEPATMEEFTHSELVPVEPQPGSGLLIGQDSERQSLTSSTNSNDSGTPSRKRKLVGNDDELANLIGITTKRTKTLATQAVEKTFTTVMSPRSGVLRRESKRAAAQAAAAVVASAVAAQKDDDKFDVSYKGYGKKHKNSKRIGGRPKGSRKVNTKLTYSSDEGNDAAQISDQEGELEGEHDEGGQPAAIVSTAFEALLGLAEIAETDK